MKKTYKIFIILAFFLLVLTTNIYASSVVMDLESNNINSNINQNENNFIYNNTNENNPVTSNTLNVNNSNNFNDFSQNDIADNTADNSISSSSSTVQTSNPVVTTTSSNDDNFLTVENILSISIIVIGVLLIFLSIAILIRCKQ